MVSGHKPKEPNINDNEDETLTKARGRARYILMGRI